MSQAASLAAAWPAEQTRAVLGALVLVALSALASALYLVARRKRRRSQQVFKLGRVPEASEPAGAFSGHLLNVISTYDNAKRLHALHLKLGKTFGLFYGPDPWLMTIDLELLQRVFVAEGAAHVNVTDLRLPFLREINDSLAQLRGDKWRQMRRVMGPSFTWRHMKSDNVLGDIAQVCDAFMELIELHGRPAPSSRRRPIVLDVHYAFKRFSLEVIFRVAFGRAYKQRFEPNEPDKLIDWLEQGAHMLHGPFVQAGIMFDWTQRLLGLCAHLTPLGAIIRFVHTIVDESLARRRALLEAAGEARAGLERKTIDSLIESFQAGKLDNDTLKANLFFMLLAGYETSANTLALLFYFLAANPQAQDQLRSCILADGGHQSAYLDWTIQETLRLFPAVPVAIGRVLEHDIEHAGMKIFKGTTVVADTWTIHRWPEYWSASSESELELFRPERFGEPVPEGANSLRYFAFGAGPRYCIGQNLALNEIKCIVQRVLSKYRVGLCASSPRQIDAISPNLIHFIIRHKIELEFTEISSL